MHFPRFPRWTTTLISIVIGLTSNELYAVAAVTHNWYVDLAVGKTYDYANSNSFLVSPAGTSLGNLRSSNTYSSPYFFAGIGHIWSLNHSWLPYVSLGLQHRYTSPVNVYGISQTPSVNAEPTIYNYRMQEENVHIAAKANIYKWKILMPYIAMSAGASFNRITQFFVNSPTYANQLGDSTNLTEDFSYSIGAGVDFALANDLWFGIGYSYDSFGKNKVNSIFTINSATPFSGSLQNANLHANSVYLSARYLFA